MGLKEIFNVLQIDVTEVETRVLKMGDVTRECENNFCLSNNICIYIFAHVDGYSDDSALT